MDQDLVDYLDTRFHSLEQRIDQRFDQVDQRFDQVDQRFEQVDQHFEQVDQHFSVVDGQIKGVRQEMGVAFDEVKRHAGVLVEDLRYQVRLVAESLALHVEAETSRHHTIQEQFRATHALIHSSYAHLQQQHNHLKERVEHLEQTGRG